jgi:Asp/Glu/hydantoin racemase
MSRITLIHAVMVAIQPVLDAFAEDWPGQELTNLLDDGLTGALAREGGLTPRITKRICDLATFAARNGADGILFTCSAFTPAMDLARQLVSIPLLKPDEAMIAAALDAGRRIGVVATMPATPAMTESQLGAAAAARGVTIEVSPSLAAGAFRAIQGGDAATHDRLVVDAALRIAPAVDVICLAQFSMARTRAAVQARVGVPVLASPTAAVAKLRAALTATGA